MAAGSTDSNGVYQYGSSDTNATFHGLLNIANAILSTTIGAMLTRITNAENKLRRTVASLAALDAVSTAAVGHTAYLTTPGTTGVDPHGWVAVSGSGASLKWKPDGPIIVDTKAHLDAYIAAVILITDLSFAVGGEARVGTTRYRFTSTAGAYLPFELACSLRKSANYNLTTSAVALTWDVEISDPAGMHDNGSNTSRLVAVEAGLYEVCASLYNNNTSGLGNVEGRLNGTTAIPGSFDRRTGDAGGLPLKSIFSIALAAGDYVEIMVQHASAAGAIEGGTTRSAAVVTMKRVGP